LSPPDFLDFFLGFVSSSDDSESSLDSGVLALFGFLLFFFLGFSSSSSSEELSFHLLPLLLPPLILVSSSLAVETLCPLVKGSYGALNWPSLP
jgi:hypothetical protein